ncbi:MAG: helix-turn-helix domain-containing protein [Saccharofermentans sp.]|nr:helix-turn-helix domain-containing protein [Saccharofermentans sp.]
MNSYINADIIRTLREKNKMTQADLACKLGVSDKTISKWETGRGLPDISLVEDLASALGISVGELFAGEKIINTNISSSMLRTNLYVCPICGNQIVSVGKASISCCGITLPSEEFEEQDEEHMINIEKVEDELYVTINHPMTKEHYISSVIYRTYDRVEIHKLYPESNAECRFLPRGRGDILAVCNRHGAFRARFDK